MSWRLILISAFCVACIDPHAIAEDSSTQQRSADCPQSISHESWPPGTQDIHYDIDYLKDKGSNFDYYFQLYATAPFLKPSTIRDCVNKLTHTSRYDSILTATEEYGWFWYNNQPVNYQPNILPRSQDVVPMIKETTGLYGISKIAYNRYRSRVGANPYFYIIRDGIQSIDIDDQSDFDLAGNS